MGDLLFHPYEHDVTPEEEERTFQLERAAHAVRTVLANARPTKSGSRASFGRAGAKRKRGEPPKILTSKKVKVDD